MPSRSAELVRHLTSQLKSIELARRLRLGEGVAGYSRAFDPLSEEWLVNTRKLIATGQLASAQEAIAYVNARAAIAGARTVDLTDAVRGVDLGYGKGPLGGTLDRYQRLGRRIADRDGQEAARVWMKRQTKRAAGDLAWGAGQDTMRAAIDAHPDCRGYRRIASAGACGACLALATGVVLPASEAFPRHPSCRCTAEPVFDGDPQIDRPTGEEYFNGLTEKEQLAILGPEKLDAYQAGKFKFADLAASAHRQGSTTGLFTRSLEGLRAGHSSRVTVRAEGTSGVSLQRPRGTADLNGPLGRTLDPDGHEVTLWPSDWEHVQDKPGRDFTPGDVLAVVRAPHLRRKGKRPETELYFREGLGPTTWLVVVVAHGESSIVWTAHPQRKSPKK